ncbi:hypothetical protein [Mycobacterium sp. E2479]|uniref:hypothetical protein n=1 Tax=Mycobacterium sp. E2479 TaxID=1834134 RepID=UPI0007FCCA78|nr:hypothetical protein [Mycobacterium sp. E2479]OBH55420.1 hypothetical protein A5686_06130 [Mycobacterium sp. E2479]
MNQPVITGNDDEFVVPVVPTTLAVYRNLRIGLAITAVMLTASIIIQSTYMRRPTGKDCWQGALSEYFYTSAHSIFVAGLVGLATLFFVYRGSTDTENALLTLAGVAALTAALVPQRESYIKLCTPPPLFIPDEVKVAVATVIRPNLVAIVAALAVAWLITLFQHHYDRRNENGDKILQKKSPGGKCARFVLWLVVVVGLIALCTPKVDSRDYAHGAAGVLLLSSFIATVFATAVVASRETHSHCIYKVFYWVWAVVMLLTFFGILAVHLRWPIVFGDLWGTYVEGAVLLEFCVYWVVQTFDLWDDPDRRYRLSPDDRKRLAQTYVRSEKESLGAKIMSFL